MHPKIFALRLLAALLAGPAFSQLAEPAPAEPTDPGLVIRTETQLVLTPFHVVHKGGYVEDLRKEDVKILVDGVEHPAVVFEGPSISGKGTVPVEIILLLDISLSVMNHGLLDLRSIKETFLDELGGDTKVSIYAFAKKLRRYTGPTNDAAKLDRALQEAYASAGPGTRLYESILQTCRNATASGGDATRVMIVFSDGFATGKVMIDECVAAARHYGITLYPVVLGHERLVKRGAVSGGGGAPAVRGGAGVWGGQQLPGVGRPDGGMSGATIGQAQARSQEGELVDFAKLGERTGGRSFDPKLVNHAMVKAILRSVVQEIQSEYVAGFYPSGGIEPQAKLRKVQVKLAGRPGKVRGGHRTVSY